MDGFWGARGAAGILARAVHAAVRAGRTRKVPVACRGPLQSGAIPTPCPGRWRSCRRGTICLV